jgi:hypothetical protein
MQFPFISGVITSMLANPFHKDYKGVPPIKNRGRVFRYIFFAKKQKRMPLQPLTRYSEQTFMQTANVIPSEERVEESDTSIFQMFCHLQNPNQHTSSSFLWEGARGWAVSVLFLFTPFFVSAQVDTTFRNSVLRTFDVMRTGEDSEKQLAAAKLETMFSEYYSDPAHFELELDSVPFLGQLSSEDGVIRMLCWNLVLESDDYQYHCVMRHKLKKEAVVITVFQDNVDWKRIEHKPIRANNWYGALYYKILANRYRRKTYYTILGWDGKDNITNRKVVDVISIQGKSVILGSSIFRNEKELPVHRLIYEYANDVSMALNFDEKEKMIVMDHLAPEDSRFVGQYQFYGPDFSYDALKFKKGAWIFERDVFAKNRSLNNLPDNARPGDFKD